MIDPSPARPTAAPSSASAPELDAARDALRAVIDPETGIDIVSLGLVYAIALEADAIHVTLTMTSPACPMAEMILDEAEAALRRALPHCAAPQLTLTWSPAWEPSMMSADARRQFGW